MAYPNVRWRLLALMGGGEGGMPLSKTVQREGDGGDGAGPSTQGAAACWAPVVYLYFAT